MQKTAIRINEYKKSYCDHSNRHKTVFQLFEEIVKSDNPEVLFDFSWSKEIKAEEFTLSSVTLTECDIEIPVSIENIERLKHISLKLPSHNKGCNLPFNPSLRKAWEISTSEICGSTQQDINLSSLVVYHLQLPTKDVQAQLQKLIIFEPGNQCFINNCSSCIANNKIGTVVLQLPVEGGHEGGRLNVEYERKHMGFENHGNSDKSFYLTAFYNCCKEFMEPVTRGHKLILVFDLIWTDTKTEIPKNFPVFLTALKGIKQVLKPWIRQNVVDLELMGPRPSTSENQEESSEGNLSDHSFSEWTLKEKILFIILKEGYEEKSLAFELLRGQDRVLVEHLLNCGFLDVHLAMANSKSKSESVNQEKGEELGSIAISTLIDSNDVTRNLSFELDWNKHFVELFQLNQEKEAYFENRKEKVELSKRNLHNGVIVIWPKHHSVPIYCQFGLPSLLIRMGQMLNSSQNWKDETRQSVTSDLRQLVSFCRAEPQRAWTTPGLGKGELTLRLLRFCITLRAREEGLDLLQLLGLNFDSENFEGIQNDQVAQAIADFVSQVTVWREVAELMKPLFYRDRIAKQLPAIMKLAKCLLRTNCVQGAKMVGDSVSSFFTELDQTRAAKLKNSDIEAYMDMVVSLETNPDTCCRSRTASFVLFFYKLQPSRLQYRLVRDLKTKYSWCLKSMQSFQFLLRELYESLINLPEVRCVSSAENVPSGSLIPVNDKENSENHTSSSCTQPKTRSLLTPFPSTQTHTTFFLNQNSQTTNTTSTKFQSSMASLNVPCDTSVHYYSPRNNVSTSNYPETTLCISGGGFLLERFREVFDSAVEGETSLTGGSICSMSDYLFQLRDFNTAYEAISMSSVVKSDQQTGFIPKVCDHSIEDIDYIPKSIQEENSKAIVVCSPAATSSIVDKPVATPKAKNSKSTNQQLIVPLHSPWNTASKPNQPDSSSIRSKGSLLERFRELWDPSIEETSTTGGSICSISDYRFQLRDFELAYAEISATAVSADQPPEYGMVVNKLPNEWVRKLPQVEDDHCQASAVGFRSFASSPLTVFHSTLTARCEDDDRKYPKLTLENSSLDDAETSTSSCRAVSITEPKVKANSSGNNSDYFFGWLVPTSTSNSPGATSSSSINKSAYRTAESSLCTMTVETVLASKTPPKTESSVVSTVSKDGSALCINETFEKPFSGTFIWKGAINSKEVGKFNVKAFEVNASKFIPNLNMPSTLELIGRVKPEIIWDYINQTRRAGTRDIVVFSFLPASDSSQEVYSSFIRHMHDKERIFVVGPFSKLIKDFYLVPLLKDSPIPSALNSFTRGIELFENRTSSVLLGIVIPSRKREALQACAPAVP